MRSTNIVKTGLLLIGVIIWLGMSGMGGDEGPRRIPTPDRNFAATIVDRADVRTQLTMFSINGYTYFFARQGEGHLAVPFQNIKRIDFSLSASSLTAVLTLVDGQKVSVSADKQQQCFGVTSIGNYSIKLADVKALTIDRQILGEAAKQ